MFIGQSQHTLYPQSFYKNMYTYIIFIQNFIQRRVLSNGKSLIQSGVKSDVGNPREDDTVQIEKKWIPRWTTKWDPLRSEILSAREEQTPLVYSTISTEVSEEEPEGANGMIELEPAQLAKVIAPVLSRKRMAHRQSPTIFTRYMIVLITNFFISYYIQLK